jgi:galactose oxidase
MPREKLNRSGQDARWPGRAWWPWEGVLLFVVAGCGGRELEDEDIGATRSALVQGSVTLVAQHSGKCVAATSGAATQQTCSGATSQQWSFKAVTGGYQIVSVATPGQCLNISGASTTAGAAVAVSACSSAGVAGEIWSATAVGSNFNFVANQSQMCMDVTGRSTANGAAVIQWTCSGQTNQLWAMQPVAPTDASSDATSAADSAADARTDATIPSDAGVDAAGASAPAVVELVAQHSGKCVGVSGAVATQQTCTGVAAQQWSFKAVTGGLQITSASTPSMCLNIAGASTTAGQAVAVSSCSAAGVPGEIWSTKAVGTSVNLIATHDQMCMDVSGNSTADGASVIQWTCNGQTNQLWGLQTVAVTGPVDGGAGDAGAANGGQWSAVITLPSIPVAAAMLPSGRILTWASWEPDNFGGSGDLPRTYTNMFDPQTLTATSSIVTQTTHDMFCPGTAMLSDGRVLINGGGPDVANTSLFDSLANTWAADALMNQIRWYNVSAMLPDGRVFTMGGNRLSGLDGRGEIWTAGGSWQVVAGAAMTPLLTTDPTNRSQEHPRLFVAPNGKIFVPGPTPNMQWYDLTGSGTVTSAGPRGDDVFSQNDVTVLFNVGKFLKAGGNTNYDMTNAATTPSSANAYVIDVNGGGLAAVTKIAPLIHARAYATGVLLPDGTVLVVGGLNNGKAFSDTGAILTPELFDPTSSTWRELAPMLVPRTYHSVALLMPDARVFVGGGGLCGTGCAANHSDAQIYSPPYLFQGARPQITAAPTTASYGAKIAITTTGTVSGFSWIRMSSVTHTVNTDQRWLPAPSTPTSGGAFSVTVPANANVAPPGYYMLFALSGSVPSVARLVRIGM